MIVKCFIFCLFLEFFCVFSQNFTGELLEYTVHKNSEPLGTSYADSIVRSFNDGDTIVIMFLSIKSINSTSFNIKHRTKLLFITQCFKLAEIGEKFLYDQNTIGMTLKIHSANITKIQKHTFTDIFVETIDFLENLELESIEDEAFYSLFNLKSLLIKRCKLTAFNPKAFKFLLKLKVLSFSQNQITALPDYAFEWILNNSTEIDLSSNWITTLSNYTFKNLEDRNFTINLYGNRIYEISEFVFADNSFFSIDMYDNKITELSKQFFSANFSLNFFVIECLRLTNVSLKSLYTWANTKNVKIVGYDCVKNNANFYICNFKKFTFIFLVLIQIIFN